ncbi:helix-turn-helix domain-containing protein [Aeromonas salmonicida]|uniref:helix-turn-helix domain-containing protein n=1 Tax=Aeromonas salmonicida TaxID=645 RepID=UPI001485D360|nr:helix-turn-helix transcriptional regulator [Aeromonas salmonicida]
MVINRLRELRVAAGFRSAVAFADAVGRPSSTVTSHENGARKISKEDLELYCRYLNVKPEDIIRKVDNHFDLELVASYISAFCSVQKRKEKRIDGNMAKKVLPMMSSVQFTDEVEMELFIEGVLEL